MIYLTTILWHAKISIATPVMLTLYPTLPPPSQPPPMQPPPSPLPSLML
jgi:hypothetical protein